MQAAGEVSVRPHAWVRSLPVTSFQRLATDSCTAMPPPSVIFRALKSIVVEAGCVQQSVEQRVDAGDEGERILLQLRDHGGEVARVDDQHVLPAQAREQQAVRRQREDVIQRNRRDQRAGSRGNDGPIQASACRMLAHMLPCVSMAPFATPVVPPVYCRKARSSGRDRRPDRARVFAPSATAGLKSAAPSMCHGRTCLRTLAHHVVDDGAISGKPSKSPAAVTSTCFSFGARQHLLHHVREVLEHQDAGRAGVGELVFQLGGRVQRIGVDHDEPGAQRAKHRDRILQHIRQHDREAVALLESGCLLQPGGEVARRARRARDRSVLWPICT